MYSPFYWPQETLKQNHQTGVWIGCDFGLFHYHFHFATCRIVPSSCLHSTGKVTPGKRMLGMFILHPFLLVKMKCLEVHPPGCFCEGESTFFGHILECSILSSPNIWILQKILVTLLLSHTRVVMEHLHRVLGIWFAMTQHPHQVSLMEFVKNRQTSSPRKGRSRLCHASNILKHIKTAWIRFSSNWLSLSSFYLDKISPVLVKLKLIFISFLPEMFC